MSTSDQQGQGPLTRKQLREIRLTGSTPVISADEAAAAAAATPAPPEPPTEPPADRSPEPDAGAADGFSTPLTRRQVREKERTRTASVPVSDPAPEEEAASTERPGTEQAYVVDAGGVTEPAEVADPAEAAVQVDEVEILEPVVQTEDVARGETVEAEIVSEVPRFSTPDDDESDVVDDLIDSDPVRAAGGRAPSEPSQEDERIEPSQGSSGDDDIVEVLGIEPTHSETASDDDVLADVGDDDDSDVTADERPTVNPGFGQGVLSEEVEHKPFSPSFDELLTVNDSTGSQHIAPSALIFTPGSNGSLSGPVAATGEVLVTGSYELPQGLGSQGHAHGTTDGREVDAVLIDGELPPASSPTPIAASSAVSTSKSAGEVIRPPAPEKGNKLMLTLAITAGGLALALAVALIVAFTTNVF